MNKAVPKIALKGLKKRFGPKVVLDGIDLEIATGESLVVIGGSGTGKSVLLKSIIGIIDPDDGTVLIDGEDTTHLTGSDRTELMRKFGMLFQGSGTLFKPTRGPMVTLESGIGSPHSTNIWAAGSQISIPFSLPSMAKAWHSLAGPSVQRGKGCGFRRSAIRS